MTTQNWTRPALLMLSGTLAGACAAARPEAAAKGTILFVCQHGGAKSVIAAAYFNRLAAERGLPFVGVAVAAEEPYAAVPSPVADHLAGEGFDVRSFEPRQAEPGDLAAAAQIIGIDADTEALGIPPSAIERWDDVPKVSVDLEGSAAVIRAHVDALAKELGGDG